MQTAKSSKSSLPFSVMIVVLIFSLSALWQLFTRAIPAFIAGHPDALSEAIGFVFSALVVWGLVTLRPWARTFVLFVSGVGVVIPALVLGLLQHPEFASGFHQSGIDSGLIVRFLTIVGVLSLVSFLLLKSDSAKEAFGVG